MQHRDLFQFIPRHHTVMLVIQRLQLLRIFILVACPIATAIWHIEFDRVFRLDDTRSVGMKLYFTSGFGG